MSAAFRWATSPTIDIRKKETMNQTASAVSTSADTQTSFLAGERNVNEATRWEREALTGEIETPRRSRENCPAIMRIENQAIDDALIGLFSVPSESNDACRLAVHCLTRPIDHLNGYRHRLQYARRGVEVTA